MMHKRMWTRRSHWCQQHALHSHLVEKRVGTAEINVYNHLVVYKWWRAYVLLGSVNISYWRRVELDLASFLARPFELGLGDLALLIRVPAQSVRVSARGVARAQ